MLRIDIVTGNCGLCPQTLFRRIGTMAARGCHPLPPRHKQTTPTPSRPDRPRGPATGCGWRIGKPSGGMVHPAKTTPASIHVRTGRRARQPETDGGRQAVQQGLDRVLAHRLSCREPMTARAGP